MPETNNHNDDDAAHDQVPLHPVPIEIIAEWEPGTFIENLAPLPDGSWLVTIPSHNRIDRVDSTGHHDVLTEFAHYPTGIVTDGDTALAITGTIGLRDWQLFRVDADGQTLVCDLPELVFGNGMQWAGEHLIAADSSHGLLLAIDPDAGHSSVWLQHPTLTPPDDIPRPGANGIAVHDGWVYVSNTGRAMLVRSPLGSADPAAETEVVARRLVADDFAVHPDGRIFLATHRLNSVLRLAPDGSRVDIAGHEQGIAGSTAVALDPNTPDTLYVTTTGGSSLHRSSGKPARLVRLRLSA